MSEASDLIRCVKCVKRKPSVDYITTKGKTSPHCTSCRKEWASNYGNQFSKFGQYVNTKRARCSECDQMKSRKEFEGTSICRSCRQPGPYKSTSSESNWSSYRSGFRRYK